MPNEQLINYMAQHSERDLHIQEAIGELAKNVAIVAQSQKYLSTRLFGGENQKGVLTYLVEKNDEHIKDYNVRVGSLETWRSGTKRWIAGAVAVLTLEGTALGMYFSKVSAIAARLTPHAK